MSVDPGTSSKLQPLPHPQSEIADPLGFSAAVKRCESRKATDLASTHTLATCGLALSCRMMTPDDSILGGLFLIALCSLSSVWVYRWAWMETSGSLNYNDKCL
ncbi:hypothetical protein TNCT_333171 [Trichonephila clavata]|uniref:Uncharacterized protein n=1 Tax=Trichonephila clavata TaxID=2740835 RepID=A0A8X6JDA9_TRICU|nr:hypothetical protein TNCT_333171 [Trichonephila clavata]